jgi:hypothetical protein
MDRVICFEPLTSAIARQGGGIAEPPTPSAQPGYFFQ